MRRAVISLTCAAAIAVFAAACGGDSGGSGPAFSDTVSAVQADSAGNAVADYASSVAAGLNFNGPSIGLAAPAMFSRAMARFGAAAVVPSRFTLPTPDFSLLRDLGGFARTKGPQFSVAEGCTYSSHGLDDFPNGSPIDLNNNGIPDDAGIRVECQLTDSTSNPDTVTVQYLFEEVSVKEIAGSLWGEQIAEQVHFRNSDNFGDFIDEVVSASGKTDLRSSSASDQANLTVAFSARLPGDSSAHGYSAGENFNNAFTTVGTIAYGDPLPNGLLTIGGNQFETNTDGMNISFGISTTTPLAYSASCAAVPTNPPFTAGALRGMLNANSGQARFDVTFGPACGNVTVVTQGTTS
jgi:hypothetical protein